MNRICELMMILYNLQNPSNTPTSSASIYHMCIKLQFDISRHYVNSRDFQQELTSMPTLSHNAMLLQRGFDEDWLGDTFSRAVLLGNGLVAILSGLLANTLVDTFSLGPVAPFDAAAALLAVGGATIWFTWPENYGDKNVNKTLVEQLREAGQCIRNDQRVLLLGVMQV
jgi:hypothetical protein